MTKHQIYAMSVARVYPLYVAKAEKKGRTKEEVDEIIRWLTGYSQEELEVHWKSRPTLRFFWEAPNESCSGPDQRCSLRRAEEIEEPIMQEIVIWIS